MGESALAKAERIARTPARWARGTEGAPATAISLADLTGGEWVVVEGLAWPGRRGSKIDYVAVGPTGVFVIDSLRWSGRIATVGGVLLRNGKSQARTTRDAHAAALALGELLPSVSPDHVVPVICFGHGDVPDVTVDGVLVCSIVTVVHHLTARPSVLTKDDVQAVARELRQGSGATESKASSTALAQPVRRPQKRGLLGRLSS